VRIRTGDTVEVISGDDRGKQGKVLSVNPKSLRLLIEGMNFMKRQSKPTQQNQQGGIIEREASVHVSNVMLVVSGSRRREQTLLFQLCLPADSVGSALTGVS
jgi:large subunit ribosomal protein L24